MLQRLETLDGERLAIVDDINDVYAEANDEGTAVFVRDRGRGFDQDAVAADRRGVSHSIIDRMARHGGRAEVISSDAGTEVRLYLPKEDS